MKENMFFSKNVSRPSNPPDELTQNVSKKSLSDELFLHFFFESLESDRVFNCLHDSNSIFRAAGKISEIFFGRTVHELLDWLQEFRENLVDESSSTEPWRNPDQGSQDTSKSSHELPMESPAKVDPGSGKHSANTHFPKDLNCDVCLKTKITRASRRRRAGTVVPRAAFFGDLITADDKMLSEESESRDNHSICRGGTRLGHRPKIILSGNKLTRAKLKLPTRPRRAK